MNKFLRTTLAVILGTLIVNVITIIIVVSSLGRIELFPETVPSVPQSCVLTIDMSKVAVTERTPDADLSGLLSGLVSDEMISAVTLHDLDMAIRIAAEDSAVKYIFLKTDGMTAGIAQVAEIRQALQYFHDLSGKPIIAYMESPSAAGCYVASIADKVYTTSYEGSNMMLLGVSTEIYYIKDLLDKLGVKVQLIRHGKYKSAGEMYIKNAPSAENIEQNKRMVESLWTSYATTIAQARGLELSEINDFVDNLKLVSGHDMELAGLVDGCLTKEELRVKLAECAGSESYDKVKFISVADYATAMYGYIEGSAKQKIAVIYVDGEIVDGYGRSNVAGDRYAKVIADVRNDKSVKAVVLRVNSPGGSVLASEKIKAELDLLKGVKPLVASFGDYAASGGYWISAGCDKIYANPTTLTGSIGVFSMIPDLSGTMKNLVHINPVSISSNSHSDMFSLMRPLDAKEVDFMQAGVESVYDRFLGIVAEGRGMTPEAVDAIAQGRVWTGADAKEIGLVDEFGTLDDAITFAEIAAGDATPTAWKVVSYPEAQTIEQSFAELFEPSEELDVVKLGMPFLNFSSGFYDWIQNVRERKNFMFARLPYLTSFE